MARKSATPAPLDDETTLPPTPAASDFGSVDSSAPTETKKKRKRWGEEVGPIKQVIGPRKRAKTEEEKLQRAQERVVRNRKAADRSRQKQKAEKADLELENTRLRNLLARYKAEFGPITPTNESDEIDTSEEFLNDESVAPVSSHSSQTADNRATDSTVTVADAAQPATFTPEMMPDDSLIYVDQDFDNNGALDMYMSTPGSYTSTQEPSFVGHHSAVMEVCLQCPTKTDSKLHRLFSQAFQSQSWLQMFQALLLVSILPSFSLTTLSMTKVVFQVLTSSLSMAMPPIKRYQTILRTFPLIHTLISMPSTETRPAVFRLKLLSKLLACHPHMAPYLKAAASASLRQVVDREDFAQNADTRWAFSSLMAIQWSISRLKVEHRKIRKRTVFQSGQKFARGTIGAHVDEEAVWASRHLWESSRREQQYTLPNEIVQAA